MSQIICIGSVLWDVIGRSPAKMPLGADRPGRITRQPGGVALNIAVALRRFGAAPVLLSSVGRDASGDALIAACQSLGLETAHIHRPDDLPTDTYMAIEGANGLIAAIADAHSLEAAGDAILAPLQNGSLSPAPYTGPVALDGNLTEALLRDIATGLLLAQADLRVAPASPGKATRLTPFLTHPKAVLYVNLEEAGLLCDTLFTHAEAAARGLLERGAHRVLVTHGADAACDGSAEGLLTATPRHVTARQITGAGDMFMAAHIAAELNGKDRRTALSRALDAAATHVAGETPQ